VKLNLDLLTGRIEIIRVSLQRLKELACLSEDEFLGDYRNPASAETFIRHCLEAIFDIGRHILAKSGNIRLTHEYKSIARRLGETGVVSKELSERLSQMAGYRNRCGNIGPMATPDGRKIGSQDMPFTQYPYLIMVLLCYHNVKYYISGGI